MQDKQLLVGDDDDADSERASQWTMEAREQYKAVLKGTLSD
jgi:hypothetical protein